ncbi:hypothetical protein L6164_036486 [Bauhinia variegata]|uniref:Uncharacterized protein n=1 Tax=Bauhinia variegata TaxID=167791 RepID=A0ACB9KH73_BAUVA|nr:hypothetical protein L6164_036486 [Bauhinia variegata]
MDGTSRGRLGRNRSYGDDTVFKSKNLDTERRRRAKLSDRLLTLRALVPIITNMNKATIIIDAITYIKQLQGEVDSLTRELEELEATEEIVEPKFNEVDAAQQMHKCGIQPEVTVTQIDGNKLWIKIVFEKKKGRFKKLIETMNAFGIELMDTNATTTKGAFLITSCIRGKHGEQLEAQQTKELLIDIINAM